PGDDPGGGAPDAADGGPDAEPPADEAADPARNTPTPPRADQAGPESHTPSAPPREPGEAVEAPQDRPEVMGSGSAMPVGAPARLSRVAARRFTVPGVGEGAPGRRSRARTDTGRVVRPSD